MESENVSMYQFGINGSILQPHLFAHALLSQYLPTHSSNLESEHGMPFGHISKLDTNRFVKVLALPLA